MTPSIHKLINFISMRNKISPWCKHQVFDDWRVYIQAELDELYIEVINDGTQAHINEELGDLLVLVLSMSARYGSLVKTFDAAYTKMCKRAPYVLEGRLVNLAEELRLWAAGKQNTI